MVGYYGVVHITIPPITSSESFLTKSDVINVFEVFSIFTTCIFFMIFLN